MQKCKKTTDGNRINFDHYSFNVIQYINVTVFSWKIRQKGLITPHPLPCLRKSAHPFLHRENQKFTSPSSHWRDTTSSSSKDFQFYHCLEIYMMSSLGKIDEVTRATTQFIARTAFYVSGICRWEDALM